MYCKIVYEIQCNQNNNNSTNTMYFILITLSLMSHWPQQELWHCIFSNIYFTFICWYYYFLERIFYFKHQMYLVQNNFPVFKGNRSLISVHLSDSLRRWRGSPLHDCKVSQSIVHLNIGCHVLKGTFRLVIYLWREVRQWRRPTWL